MKINHNLVSIIIPIYNVEKYLHRCLDSVLNQTYKNLEIILIDDGSTDSSGKICDEYKYKDNRIIAIHQSNLGVAVARNKGINTATGDYISFIDSDDYVSDNFIEVLLNLIINNKVDISECGILYTKKSVYQIPSNKNKSFLVDWNEYFSYKNIGSIWNKLYNKELFWDILFPPNVICGEDYNIFYKLIFKAKKIAITNLKLYCYFQRPDSVMHTKNTRNLTDRFEAEYGFMQFIYENNCSNKTINCRFLYFWDTYCNITHYLKMKKDFKQLDCVNSKYVHITNLLFDKLNTINIIRIRFPKLLYSIRIMLKFYYHILKKIFKL